VDPVKQLIDFKKEQVKQLKADLKDAKKAKNDYKRKKLEIQISEIEAYIQRFKKIKPYKVDNIVIDYKLYEDFMKKLKNFNVSEQVVGNVLIINYKRGTNKSELQNETIIY